MYKKFTNFFFVWAFDSRIIKIMKLTMFRLKFGIVDIFAAFSYSQDTPIQIRLKNAPIVQLFKEIEKQTEFIFFYKDSQDDLKKNISLELEDKDVQSILNQALYNTSLWMRYAF